MVPLLKRKLETGQSLKGLEFYTFVLIIFTVIYEYQQQGNLVNYGLVAKWLKVLSLGSKSPEFTPSVRPSMVKITNHC